MFAGLGLASTRDRQINMSNLDISNVTNVTNMFNNASGNYGGSFVLDMSNTIFSTVTTGVNTMFDGYSNATLGDFKVNMSGAVLPSDCSQMFDHITKGDSVEFTVDLSNADTSNVTSIAEMFYLSGGYNAIKICLINIDVSNWDVSNVINMSYMFSGMRTESTRYINIVGLDTWSDFSSTVKSDVNSVNSMFYSIDTDEGVWLGWKDLISNWDLSTQHIEKMQSGN